MELKTLTITVDLRRVGMSRVSVQAIPLVARVRQGSKFGENLLAGTCIADPVTAKATIQDKLAARFLSNSFVIAWEESSDV